MVLIDSILSNILITACYPKFFSLKKKKVLVLLCVCMYMYTMCAYEGMYVNACADTHKQKEMDVT